MVARAGGEEVLGRAGERSFRTTWEAVSSARPDVLVAVPCGYDRRAAERALSEIPRSLAVARVHALDASAHFSRPGPRLVEGVEALAALLHG